MHFFRHYSTANSLRVFQCHTYMMMSFIMMVRINVFQVRLEHRIYSVFNHATEKNVPGGGGGGGGGLYSF